MEEKNGSDALPLGFGFALAMDPAAMENYSAMSEEKRRQIAEAARGKKSKDEMQALVTSLSQEG